MVDFAIELQARSSAALPAYLDLYECMAKVSCGVDVDTECDAEFERTGEKC